MSELVRLPTRADASTPAETAVGQRKLSAIAWGVTGYTLLVILFGAVVRVTGSGAGCGQHWPSCHGEIAHLPRSIETVIEFTHRLTSGLSLLLVGGLLWATLRWLRPGHLARKMAVYSLVFLLLEALLGAGLVLFELVADNASPARAVVMPAHLVNTSLLMLCLMVTAWASSREVARVAWRGASAWMVLAGGVSLLAVSGTGALTALGDTLYPVAAASGLADRVFEVQGSGSFLERLRSLHPIVAVSAATLLYGLSKALGKTSAAASRLGAAVNAALLVQLGLGVINVWLSAPGWMQVLHLALANVVWGLWVILGAEVLVVRQVPSSASP